MRIQLQRERESIMKINETMTDNPTNKQTSSMNKMQKRVRLFYTKMENLVMFFSTYIDHDEGNILLIIQQHFIPRPSFHLIWFGCER